MRLYQKILATGALIAAVGLAGCVKRQEDKTEAEPTQIEIYSPHNDGRRTTSQSGISVALGDIDGDKDLDLIVGSPSHIRAYLNRHGTFEAQER